MKLISEFFLERLYRDLSSNEVQKVHSAARFLVTLLMERRGFFPEKQWSKFGQVLSKQLCNSNSHQVRRWAARGLAEIKYLPARKFIAQIRETETHPRNIIWYDAILLFLHYGTPEKQEIYKKIHSSDMVARIEGCSQLFFSRHLDLRELAIEGIKNDSFDSESLKWLVLYLGYYPHEDSGSALLRLLEHDDPIVVEYAIWAMSKVGCSNTGPHIVDKVILNPKHDCNPMEWAYKSLPHVFIDQTEIAIEYLEDAVNIPYANEVLEGVAIGLSGFSIRHKAMQILTKWFYNPSSTVEIRCYILTALGKFTHFKSDVEIFIQLILEGETDSQIIEYAISAAEKLRSVKLITYFSDNKNLWISNEVRAQMQLAAIDVLKFYGRLDLLKRINFVEDDLSGVEIPWPELGIDELESGNISKSSDYFKRALESDFVSSENYLHGLKYLADALVAEETDRNEARILVENAKECFGRDLEHLPDSARGWQQIVLFRIKLCDAILAFDSGVSSRIFGNNLISIDKFEKAESIFSELSSSPFISIVSKGTYSGLREICKVQALLSNAAETDQVKSKDLNLINRYISNSQYSFKNSYKFDLEEIVERMREEINRLWNEQHIKKLMMDKDSLVNKWCISIKLPSNLAGLFDDLISIHSANIICQDDDTLDFNISYSIRMLPPKEWTVEKVVIRVLQAESGSKYDYDLEFEATRPDQLNKLRQLQFNIPQEQFRDDFPMTLSVIYRFNNMDLPVCNFNVVIKTKGGIMRNSMAQNVDIAIITALYEEFAPVLSFLGGEDACQVFTIKGFKHYIGTYTCTSGKELKIVASWLWNYGETRTVSAIHRITKFSPLLCCMVGICGGWKAANVHLGDIIIAQAAYSPIADGKMLPEGEFRADIRTEQPEKWLVQWLTEYSKKTDWRGRITTSRPTTLRYQYETILYKLANEEGSQTLEEIWSSLESECENFDKAFDLVKNVKLVNKAGKLTAKGRKYVKDILMKPHLKPPSPDKEYSEAMEGVFATIPFVSKREKLFEEESERIRSIRAVDMEIRAFFEGCDENRLQCFAVKGVCDHGDMTKDDLFHQYSADAATCFAFGFLDTIGNHLDAILEDLRQ